MNKSLFALLAMIIFSSATSVARADILFLDFNLSYREVAQARAAATARGEKLIVIPNLTDAQRASMSGLQDQIDDMHEKWRVNYESGNYAASQDATQKEAVLTDKLQKMLGAQTLSNQAISDALDQAAKNNQVISSVIVSGHSDGHYVMGSVESDSPTFVSLAALLTKKAPSVKSLYLWGCYTAQQGAVQEIRDAMPQLKLLFGFGGLAPSGSIDNSGGQLAALLTQEGDLMSAHDLTEACQKIGSVNSFGTNLAGAVGICYVGTQGVSLMLADNSRCLNEFPILNNELQKSFWPYEMATPAGADGVDRSDPPADVEDSDLRSVYNDLQTYSNCKSLFQNKMGSNYPSLDELKFLIFFKSVEANFARQFKSDIAVVNAALKKSNAGFMLPDFNLSSTTRAKVRAAALQLGTFYPPAQFSPAANAALARLKTGLANISDLQGIPFSWVEPTSREEMKLNAN